MDKTSYSRSSYSKTSSRQDNECDEEYDGDTYIADTCSVLYKGEHGSMHGTPRESTPRDSKLGGRTPSVVLNMPPKLGRLSQKRGSITAQALMGLDSKPMGHSGGVPSEIHKTLDKNRKMSILSRRSNHSITSFSRSSLGGRFSRILPAGKENDEPYLEENEETVHGDDLDSLGAISQDTSMTSATHSSISASESSKNNSLLVNNGLFDRSSALSLKYNESSISIDRSKFVTRQASVRSLLQDRNSYLQQTKSSILMHKHGIARDHSTVSNYKIHGDRSSVSNNAGSIGGHSRTEKAHDHNASRRPTSVSDEVNDRRGIHYGKKPPKQSSCFCFG